MTDQQIDDSIERACLTASREMRRRAKIRRRARASAWFLTGGIVFWGLLVFWELCDFDLEEDLNGKDD